MRSAEPGRVHIVGAGLAGLAAAVRLAGSGRAVVVHEATAYPGGRCRSYFDQQTGMVIDNGTHLVLSGNRAVLDYARTTGGAATLDEVLVDAGGNISVIPAGTPANRVIDRFNNGMFDSVIAELRGRFDLVIFDAPPAVVAGDALLLANKVDAAVLLVRAHQEHRGLVARMINQLSDSRCELLGVLLNRPRGTAGGYLKKNYAAMAEYTAGKNA